MYPRPMQALFFGLLILIIPLVLKMMGLDFAQWFMVAVQNDKIVPVSLKEVAGKLKTVPVNGELVQTARDLGISMGD